MADMSSSSSSSSAAAAAAADQGAAPDRDVEGRRRMDELLRYAAVKHPYSDDVRRARDRAYRPFRQAIADERRSIAFDVQMVRDEIHDLKIFENDLSQEEAVAIAFKVANSVTAWPGVPLLDMYLPQAVQRLVSKYEPGDAIMDQVNAVARKMHASYRPMFAPLNSPTTGRHVLFAAIYKSMISLEMEDDTFVVVTDRGVTLKFPRRYGQSNPGKKKQKKTGGLFASVDE